MIGRLLKHDQNMTALYEVMPRTGITLARDRWTDALLVLPGLEMIDKYDPVSIECGRTMLLKSGKMR